MKTKTVAVGIDCGAGCSVFFLTACLPGFLAFVFFKIIDIIRNIADNKITKEKGCGLAFIIDFLNFDMALKLKTLA